MEEAPQFCIEIPLVLTLVVLETSLYAFANSEDPDQRAL